MQIFLEHLFWRTSKNSCFWKCSWNWEKLKIVDKGFQLYINTQDFSTSISETTENVCLFVLILWLASFGVCIYIQYFFDVVGNKLQTRNIYTRGDKKNMSQKRKEYVIRTCFTFWPMKSIFQKHFQLKSSFSHKKNSG